MREASILAADIGGTHARLGLFTRQGGVHRPAEMVELPTAAADNAASLLQGFLRGRVAGAACLAVAGAVLDGRAQGSNLRWPIDARELEASLGFPVRLLNDLEATAVWIASGETIESVELLPGEPAATGPMGIIAPGTGLGQAMLVRFDGRHRAVASEAGHIDFAPADELQVAWWRHLRERHGHVSLERACSGGALPELYRFLAETGRAAADTAAAARIRAAADAAAEISAAARAGNCPACTLALDTFAAMLGAAAGNLALQIVATGGIWLAGGIPPRILPALQTPRFTEAFLDKGRFRGLMERIPVHVLTETQSGLYGAAAVALSG